MSGTIIRLTKWKIELINKDKTYSWDLKTEENFKTKVEPILKELQERFGPMVAVEKGELG